MKVFVFIATLLIHFAGVQSTSNNSTSNRYVATFKISDSVPFGDALDDVIKTIAEEIGDVYEKIMDLPFLNAKVIYVTGKLALRIATLDIVKYLEVDHKLTYQPAVKRTKVETLSTEETPYGINLVGALALDDSNVGNIKVCIVDSGYDVTHPDLPTSNVNGGDDIGAGAWNEDGLGHGTHVAGTIAAIGGNGQGVVGVNPSGALPLHIVRVFNDDGEWFVSDGIFALQGCVDAGANIISMSIGQTIGPSEFERTAMEQMYNDGILLVASAGNDGKSDYSYPASYDSVISVAAIDENKDVASFSQFNDQVDLAAPGVGVLSTVPGGSYEAWDGTSMACPHVSGAAALVWSKFTEKSNVEIREALLSSAEDLGEAGYDVDTGYGLIRVDLAAQLLETGKEGTVTPMSTDPPIDDGCKDSPSDWVDSWGYGCQDFYNTADHFSETHAILRT